MGLDMSRWENSCSWAEITFTTTEIYQTHRRHNQFTIPRRHNLFITPRRHNLFTTPRRHNLFTTSRQYNIFTTPRQHNLFTTPRQHNIFTTPTWTTQSIHLGIHFRTAPGSYLYSNHPLTYSVVIFRKLLWFWPPSLCTDIYLYYIKPTVYNQVTSFRDLLTDISEFSC